MTVLSTMKVNLFLAVVSVISDNFLSFPSTYTHTHKSTLAFSGSIYKINRAFHQAKSDGRRVE